MSATLTKQLRTQALAEQGLGVALLHLERGDRAATRSLLTDAVAGGVSTGANASLFHGAPALEFVLGRTGNAGQAVTAAVDRVVAARLAAAARRRKEGQLPVLAEFDLVQGLAGLGAVLLSRPHASQLREVLAHLIGLASPAAADPSVPGWWCADGLGHEEIPGGHGNNGMAHGVAGILSLCALAACHGVDVPGQQPAIETFSDWLELHGGYWTTRDQLTTTKPTMPRGRPSWCYGDLGIARARQLGAIALGDRARARSAENAAVAALDDPVRIALITDASLCHGWAGLLALTRAIAADSPDPGRLSGRVNQLADRVAAGINDLAKPGFLEGRAGARTRFR
ncbi:lanthionine synthetase C family protein [Frankia sp. AgB1.9]|uniref:lanthionine synthetase C family protein n=1 Tax=unclassified Frankia TaxID=2632575 RepID=UPI001932DDB2|nr:MULTISPECIES: lanthionine synthetase C family protein [unclassified Frankia]MBL7490888.1 lanthionine synthetase C family protein [Frankia sp. AgW1.1]MBL7548328.1 lanthionine synthetase C family protein [Frankia sp. AgB1.9]MBL7619036.1 lanthionine synthetase C family protein [Frankia sp. AgB1.8]